jgi:hypothetical protein
MPRRIRLNTENRGDGYTRQPFPGDEAEHLGIGVAESRQGGDDEVARFAVDRRVVGAPCRRGSEGEQSIDEATPPRRAPPLVPDHAVGDAVHPQQRLLAVGNFVDASPHREEGVGDRIVDGVDGDPATAIVADRYVTAGVELDEPRLTAGVTGGRGGAPFRAHGCSCPNTPDRDVENLRHVPAEVYYSQCATTS